MQELEERFKQFYEYYETVQGKEKQEDQTFLNHFFRLLGYNNVHEAGGLFEHQVSTLNKIDYPDLYIPNKVIIEMKSRGQKFSKHVAQLDRYNAGLSVKESFSGYAILCNFDEFQIYDFRLQDEPLDNIKVSELRERIDAFSFLFKKSKTPIFKNNVVEITKKIALRLGELIRSINSNPNNEETKTQRFLLQCIFCMFAEDFLLLPESKFTRTIERCISGETNSYDALGGLFRQMNSKTEARGGSFVGVKYFNGGLFDEIYPIELTKEELVEIHDIALADWKTVSPEILGTIFQHSLNQDRRHEIQAHFTSREDILKIVNPTIIQQFEIEIENLLELKHPKSKLIKLLKKLHNFKVLDPACGSGNFLFVSYMEMVKLEIRIKELVYQFIDSKEKPKFDWQPNLKISNFYGIDIEPFSIELAKVTLVLGRLIAMKNAKEQLVDKQLGLDFDSKLLPLTNLDDNFICDDALFVDWFDADVIIGNPPFHGYTRLTEKYGLEYARKLDIAFPLVPSKADFCVYWFHKAHGNLKKNQYAGMVGTNTISQNNSRIGGLGHIVQNGGVIHNAIKSQDWSGDAIVRVAIVNWVMDKKLSNRLPKSLTIDKVLHKMTIIPSNLSINTDVTAAKKLMSQKQPSTVFQGQTPSIESFKIDAETYKEWIKKDTKLEEVIFPAIIGNDILKTVDRKPSHYVIDFADMDLFKASSYDLPFNHVKKYCKPAYEKKSIEKPNSKDWNRALKTWWCLYRARVDSIKEVKKLSRYIAVVRVSKRPVFVFLDSKINPNESLNAFLFEDYYSFGIIHSVMHSLWYQELCSTMKDDPRYTPTSIWHTFPFPQKLSQENVDEVALAAREFRNKRMELVTKHGLTLEKLYQLIELGGDDTLNNLKGKLDKAVIKAYGFDQDKDLLEQLLKLNFQVAENEKKGKEVQKAGLPSFIEDSSKYVYDEECIKP